MFADDSSTIVANTKQIVEARIVINKFEKATGAKLHDGKTKVMKLGKTRKEKLTNKQIQVDFTIMEEDGSEEYLGDIIGNEVTEDQRFGKKVEGIEKEGSRWIQAHTGVYGRAVVANTLLLAKIKYRSDVNALSNNMKKKILKDFKSFMWKGKEKKARVKWEIMVRKEDEGGVGVRDPNCALDASKIRMLKRLMTRDRQPWMKWVERKLIRVARRWGVKEAMAAKTSSKQKHAERRLPHRKHPENLAGSRRYKKR